MHHSAPTTTPDAAPAAPRAAAGRQTCGTPGVEGRETASPVQPAINRCSPPTHTPKPSPAPPPPAQRATHAPNRAVMDPHATAGTPPPRSSPIHSIGPIKRTPPGPVPTYRCDQPLRDAPPWSVLDSKSAQPTRTCPVRRIRRTPVIQGWWVWGPFHECPCERQAKSSNVIEMRRALPTTQCPVRQADIHTLTHDPQSAMY